MRKVFLDDLPRKEGIGALKGKAVIDWKGSLYYKVRFLYDEVDSFIEIIEYIQSKKQLIIKYEEALYKISITSIINGRLGNIVGKYSKRFKVRIGDMFKDEKRNLTILNREYRQREMKADKKGRVYTTSEKWYKYKCNICGCNEIWIEESNLLKGVGCGCCSGKVVVEGINDIATTNPELVNFFKYKEDAKNYTANSNKKVIVKCPDCNKEKLIIIQSMYENKSISCGCGDGFSYPSKIINSVLIQLGVNFTQEYSPDYLVPKEGRKSRKYSDFYLPDYNLVIEVDGKLGHEGGITYSKSNKSLDELVAIDKWKDKQHLKHGNQTIRINCFQSDLDYIKNSILHSKLINIFDLSKIDWCKCQEFAINNNKVKDVCDLWNNKRDWETTYDLAKKLNITVSTVRRYLKNGTDVGWTNYNPDIEKKKMHKKLAERSKNINSIIFSKKIEIFKDGISQGVFKSSKELSEKSELLFGVELQYTSIMRAARGERNQYKGFTFKYVEE